MLSTLTKFIATIFLLLSLLHLYWALGGQWGTDSTIPDRFKDIYHNKANKIKITVATFIVAIGLLGFSLILFGKLYRLARIIPIAWTDTAIIFIGSLFLLRAIGDFNMFGLFKKNDGSKFAEKDSRIFVPLCIILGVSCLYIGLISSPPS